MAILFADSLGNIWLFGGFGLDSAGTNAPAGAILKRPLKYNTTSKQWTWMSGGGTTGIANQAGTYGTQPLLRPEMFPARVWGSVGLG